ncbi:MAG: hypothetical protein UR73_C0038G0021 [candidate division WS6 bacterium GW2011_GWF1_35_23]|uniref:Uncharacterized protein n=1 Tax=candidate division WS6 bacterium GW2011_GWF1_35_23 TaxID=1619097 RepID=A0A0G0BZI0_9BACT|nr:MAG: hypothetical protein UR73_C0038G0021 [candidate division WS6 bacterium GW2011_GWF1_35_23]
MYYEEKIINGILHCRYTPDGKFTECSKEYLIKKIVNLEAVIKELKEKEK